MSIPNRIGLQRILREWWQQGPVQTQPHSAALFDLDGFAEVNRTHGLAAGNEILRAVAERMGGYLGSGDLIVRYSGQRILLLLANANAREAVATAEQVSESVRQAPLACGETTVSLSVSAGIMAVSPNDPPQVLLQRLEQTLAEAKRLGPGQILLHEDLGTVAVPLEGLDGPTQPVGAGAS